jgi:hypothetical protein
MLADCRRENGGNSYRDGEASLWTSHWVGSGNEVHSVHLVATGPALLQKMLVQFVR